MSFKFSIIIPIYNTARFLKETVDRVINQSIDFKENIELIFVDDGSTDNSKEICLEYCDEYPSNIKYLYQNHVGQSKARNLGLKEATGDIITFLDSDDKFKLNCLAEVNSFFKNNDIDFLTIPMFFFDGRHGKHHLNDKFAENRIVDPFDDISFIQTSVPSCFFKKSIIENVKFNEELRYFENVLFINDVLLDDCKVGLINTTDYEYRIRRDGTALINDYNNKKEFYFNFIKFFKSLVTNKLSEYSKRLITYYLNCIFKNKHILQVLSSNELNEFLNELSDCLKYVDNNFIINNRDFSKEFKLAILKLKYDDLNVDYNNGACINSKDFKCKCDFFNTLIIDDAKLESDVISIDFHLFSLNNDIPNLNIGNQVNFNLKHESEIYFKLFFKKILFKHKFNITFDLKEESSVNFSIGSVELDIDSTLVDDVDDFYFVASNKNLYFKRLSHDYKVSVIIPVYNVENYLRESLDSVINQTLNDIEIICIDDGSTDNSLEILREYSKKDTRIKVISKENEGQGPTRNLGIELAKGKYISFVDSDDIIKSNMLETLYNKMVQNDLELVMCPIERFDNETGEKLGESWYYDLKYLDGLNKEVFNHKDTKKFTFNVAVTPPNKLYKKSFLLKNNIKFPTGVLFEDEVFFIKVYTLANRISIVNHALYCYRVNRKGSTMKKRGKRTFDVISIFNLIKNFLIDNKLFDFYKNEFFNRFVYLILKKFDETSSEYQEEFYQKIKKNLQNISKEDIENMDASVRLRLKNILKSNNLNEFRALEEYKLFSVIMPIYNTEDYLEEAIDSIINQNLDFSNIELILVDDGSTDNSKNICLNYQKKYPNNIIYFYQENQGQAVARNNGLRIAKGKYISFLDSDDKFSNDTFKNVFNFFEDNYNEVDIVSVPLMFFDRQKGGHTLNYKYKSTRVVDLSVDFDHIQLSASSAFIKKDSIGSLTFDSDLLLSEDAVFLNKILLKKMKLGVVSNATYFYRKRFIANSTIDNSVKDKRYYFPRFDKYFKELINYSLKNYGYVPKFIQFTLMYDFQWMFRIEEVDDVLSNEEINLLYKNVYDVLQYIDDDVIQNQKNIDESIKRTVFIFKNNDLKFDICDGVARLWTGNKIIDKLNYHKLYLDSVELKNGVLTILGFIKSFFKQEDIQIDAVKTYNDKISTFDAKSVSYPFRDKKIIGKLFDSSYNFEINIPLEKKENCQIKLRLKYKNVELYLDMILQKGVNLSENSIYFKKEDYLVKYEDNSFKVENYNFFKLLKYEKENIKKLQSLNKDNIKRIVKLRKSYLKHFLFKNKQIWLFMDRSDFADDNGEVLYNYALNQKDKIKKFFVISKDSKDYPRVKNMGNVVEFGSERHKLLYLLADKIISSHPDEIVLNPFWNDDISYDCIKGLISSDKYFVQHGIILHNVSSWLHRFDKHLSLVVSSSNYEYDSFFKYPYNFPKDIIQLTGLPRYDALEKQDNKKQIVIMPTWRNTFDNISLDEFKATNYYQTFNLLLNNKKLINLAKDKNYDIIFKPHLNILKYLEAFNFDDYIKVDKDSRYKDIFNESSLVITDYSSVAFDFAYLKKPLIYYHFDDEHFHYDLKDSYFNYDTMGFGKVVSLEKELVDEIQRVLLNNCKMDEIYKKRVDDFFEFNDKNNCKRVYDFILND